MAQRFSGYARQPAEFYGTPAWVTRALLPHLPVGELVVWEPAAGAGDMVDVLRVPYERVYASDIREIPGRPDILTADFLDESNTIARLSVDAVITNPPFGLAGALAVKFIRRALAVTEARRGIVAMLLKPDFDSGKSRTDLFRDCPAWSKKIVLLRRIVWFEPVPDENGKVNGPSENHCWYVWDWRHAGPAQIFYANGDEGIPE